MHDSVLSWTRHRVEKYGLAGKSVLEVGSRDVNGSVRRLFESDDYTGVDMVDGKGVDMVARADQLPFPSNHFEVVVTTEMLEHDPYFWLSLPEMARVLQPGGALLLTTRGIGFPHHDFPADYWRFTAAAIEHLLEFAGLEVEEVVQDTEFSGWLAVGRKPVAVEAAA